MKKFLLFIIILMVLTDINAQPWIPVVESEAGKKGELTFYEIQNVVEEFYSDSDFDKGYYFENGQKIKAPGWKQYKRWEWYWDSRVDIKTGEFPKTDAVTEWDKYLNKNDKEKSVSGNWQPLGPEVSNGGYAGIGRINCISFHPTDTNTYWVGAPSGGLWKTTDDGETWTVLTDHNTVLGVSHIAVPSDYETSKTLYIATGDRDGGSVWTLGGGHYYDNHSVGVLKSTDGGVTWYETGLSYSTSDTWIVSRILIDTTDNQTLYASTYSGIYKSTNGGTSWTKKLSSNYIIDMEFKPGDPSTIYAATKYSNDAKIYRSIDGGENWSEIKSFGSGSRRIELAVTPDGPDYLYAIVANRGGGLFGIYKSKDEGDSFELTFDGNQANHYLLNYYSDGSGDSTGQGNYDLALAVSPVDTNTIFIGGVNTWKSEDGGYTWNINNMWTSSTPYNFDSAPVVHADKHVLKFRDNKALFEGNDGGIYKTNNEGQSWTDLTNDMAISQLYRIGVSQNSESLVISGLQDNGTKVFYTDGNWYDVKGGDGMECIIDPTNDDIQYGTYVNGEIERTMDGWSSYNTTIISDSIDDNNGGWWVSPYMLDPNDAQTLYVGYNDVWKSADRGDNFEKISTMNTGDNLRSMAMSPANSNVIYVADRSTIWKTENGGSSWSVISSSLPTTNAITYITVKETSEDTLWVTFGGYDSNRVYESVDGGNSWTNISSGLPNLPVFTIVQNKQVTDSVSLFIGTERGVFIKNGGDDWKMFSTGLPNVMVTELDIYYNTINPQYSKLRAATYGRGLWESDLYNDPDIIVDDIVDTFYVSQSVTADIDITFSIQTTFSSNTFTAYLSDKNGNFSSEVEIGTLNSDVAGTINGAIPVNTPSGDNYSVRVKSSNPVKVSNPADPFRIVLDTVAPEVTINSDQSGTTSDNPFYVNIVFSENVTGFEQSDIILNNATVESFDGSSEPTYTVGISPSSEGTVTIDIPENSAYDVVGHGNKAATQWSITTGIELLEELGIDIYPNPSSGKLIIESGNNSISEVVVVDLSGRVVHKQKLEGSTNIVDLSKVVKGVYILRLNVEDHLISTKVMIK